MCTHVLLLALCALDGEKASTDTSIGCKGIVLKECVLSHIENSRCNAFMFHVNVLD